MSLTAKQRRVLKRFEVGQVVPLYEMLSVHGKTRNALVKSGHLVPVAEGYRVADPEDEEAACSRAFPAPKGAVTARRMDRYRRKYLGG